MTRILLVETASPLRVREKAKEILAGHLYPSPFLTILCRTNSQSLYHLEDLAGARIIPLEKSRKHQIVDELKSARFDVALLFWTGERQYDLMKVAGLRLPAARREIDIGDGKSMRLSWGNFVRFLAIRWKYPKPTDHTLYELRTARQIEKRPYEHFTGERILIVQSAEAVYVLRALNLLKAANLFQNPCYTLFCRNRPEVLEPLQGHSMLSRIIAHSKTRGAWQHLLMLRRERFDAVIVFFTGDPSYWKIKYFAFLLGARHKVIFNENNDCFFFSWGILLSLISHRMGEQSRLGGQPRWTYRARFFATYLLKVLLLPFRFVWLILVWLRLRKSGLRSSD